AWGDLYASLGRLAESQRQYDLLEFIERTGAPGSATYSRQLALFWADHDVRIEDAVALARQERATRADIYTSDTLAWCLFKAGKLVGAKAASDDGRRRGSSVCGRDD